MNELEIEAWCLWPYIDDLTSIVLALQHPNDDLVHMVRCAYVLSSSGWGNLVLSDGDEGICARNMVDWILARGDVDFTHAASIALSTSGRAYVGTRMRLCASLLWMPNTNKVPEIMVRLVCALLARYGDLMPANVLWLALKNPAMPRMFEFEGRSVDLERMHARHERGCRVVHGQLWDYQAHAMHADHDIRCDMYYYIHYSTPVFATLLLGLRRLEAVGVIGLAHDAMLEMMPLEYMI